MGSYLGDPVGSRALFHDDQSDLEDGNHLSREQEDEGDPDWDDIEDDTESTSSSDSGGALKGSQKIEGYDRLQVYSTTRFADMASLALVTNKKSLKRERTLAT